jgi:hypothetical protein
VRHRDYEKQKQELNRSHNAVKKLNNASMLGNGLVKMRHELLKNESVCWNMLCKKLKNGCVLLKKASVWHDKKLNATVWHGKKLNKKLNATVWHGNTLKKELEQWYDLKQELITPN